MSKKTYTPNEQRANVKNPNNPAHQADVANRVAQGHIAPEVKTALEAPVAPKK